MFHHRADDAVQKRIFLKWYLLSFLSGNVNAGAFMATGRFVTHVTGFHTLAGIDAANGAWDHVLGMLSVPIFFLAGAIISAYLVDHRFHRGLQPHYDRAMALATVCILSASLGGYFDFFGDFGARFNLQKDYLFLALLCLASGLQNATLTTASGSTVRTTHLTGITTDLGIGLVKVWSMKPGTPRTREVRANWLRIGTVVAFTLGSMAGATLFVHAQYLGFLLPASIAAYSTLQARREKEVHRSPM